MLPQRGDDFIRLRDDDLHLPADGEFQFINRRRVQRVGERDGELLTVQTERNTLVFASSLGWQRGEHFSGNGELGKVRHDLGAEVLGDSLKLAG